MICAGGGSGPEKIPHQDALMEMMYGSIANRMARSDPKLNAAMQGNSLMGNRYRSMMGGQDVPSYEGFGNIPTTGAADQARAYMYGGGGASPAPQQASGGKQGGGDRLPAIGISKQAAPSMGYKKGSGAYGATPTGAMANPYKDVTLKTPQTSKINALSIPDEQFNISRNLGTQAINQGNKMAQQDFMRQMGGRGLGQSGFAMKGAADLYNRGAGQQMANLGQQLSADRMGLQFGEQQQARGLEAQRDLAQAGFGLQNQAQKLQQALAGAQMGLGGRAQGLSEAMGLGQLGLADRAQGLSELTAQRSWEDAPLSALAGLGQSGISAGTAAAGGKGGGK